MFAIIRSNSKLSSVTTQNEDVRQVPVKTCLEILNGIEVKRSQFLKEVRSSKDKATVVPP